MLSTNYSLATILGMLRSAGSLDMEIEPERLKRNIFRFVAVKLVLTVMGLAFYIPVLSPRIDLVGYLGIFVGIDLLFFVPYYHFALRDLHTAIRLTQVSIALSIISMTVGLYLAGSFTHPLALIYFSLIPLALIVYPSPLMVWSAAGLATLTYTIFVTMQVLGMIPNIIITRASLSSMLPFAFIVCLGFWIEAGLLSVFAVNYELRRRDVEKRAQAESIWGTVGKTVISTQDLDQVLTTVIQVIQEKMNVETGSILLRDPGTDTIRFAKILHGDIEGLASIRLKVGQGIVGWVVQTGQSALVPDVSRDPRWYNKIDQSSGFVTRSILCVPLVTQSEVIGALELLNKRDGEFTITDQQLIESIAAPVAIAIQNARLHQRVTGQLNAMTRLFRQVEVAKEEWETTVDAIDEGIVLTDPEGQILRINNTLARWSKSTSRKMVGQFCWQAVHNQAEPLLHCPHAQVLDEKEQPRECEIEDAFLGGTFRTTAFPLRDANAKFVGVVCVLKDITNEKRMQAQLIQSEKLAATGKLAASLAHEINNPLQGIQGCLDMLQVIPDNSEREQFLSMAHKEVTRLGTLVRSMLELSRPSRGRPVLVDIPQLITEIMALSVPSIQKNSIKAEMQWDMEMPAIIGVPDQLKQVFLNLVLNAVQSMPDGGSLKIRGQAQSDAGWLTVDVIDSGVGIAPDELPHLFEPFFTTKSQGTGLGLSVCHNIVTTHGGKLTVASEKDKGSTFTVWLPIPSTLDESLSDLVDDEEPEE